MSSFDSLDEHNSCIHFWKEGLVRQLVAARENCVFEPLAFVQPHLDDVAQVFSHTILSGHDPLISSVNVAFYNCQEFCSSHVFPP
jgi:hypothetical protein